VSGGAMIKIFVVVVDKGTKQEVDSVHRFRSNANNRKFELLNDEGVLNVSIVEKELE
jgi:hypothetical protein